MIDHDVTTNEIMDFLQENMVTREEFSQLDAKVDGLDKKLKQMLINWKSISNQEAVSLIEIRPFSQPILDTLSNHA